MSFDESAHLHEHDVAGSPAVAAALGALDASVGAEARGSRGAAALSPGAADRCGAGAPVALADLPVGASAVLGSADSLTPTVLRLLEMGFTPGAKIAITRRAPGGNPIEVRVRGTRLCVRRADLARFSATSGQ